LPKDQSTPIHEVRELLKTYNGAFIGIGYIFPPEQEEKLQAICSKARISLLKMPMGHLDFAAYADSYKLDYLYTLKNDKEMKINLLQNPSNIRNLETSEAAINELKEELNDLNAAIRKRENAQLLREAVDHISPYESLLKAPSEQDICDEIRKISPGIATGYRIADMELKLEGGEISVLAAPTGHGKTSCIINILSGILERNPGSSVYLFSFEEARAPVLCLTLNCFIGEKISINNRESIKSYFRDGNLHYISENKRDLFLTRKNSFFANWIETRRLNVFYSSYTAEELANAIRFLAKQSPRPTAICIDYMQLLRLGQLGKISSRQEELKQICLLLKDCAVETGLPILIAAQFNRTVQNERELIAQAIGEAGDIERIAALILGLWNRKFNAERLEESIYVKVLKGRNIPVGSDEVFDFNGNACKISNRTQSNSADQQFNDLF
jgi:replicative DNA helicase